MVFCLVLKILFKLVSVAYLFVVCRLVLFVEILLIVDVVWWFWEVLKVLKLVLEDLGKLLKWVKLVFIDLVFLFVIE